MEVKVFSYILVFYIGVLTALPTYSAFANETETRELCSENCCSEDQSCDENSCDSKTSNSNECCPGGICNPFESCACCFGFSINKPVIQIAGNKINVTHFQPEIQKVQFGFTYDCFRPPEIV